MSHLFSVILPSGEVWIPRFVDSLDEQKCIGCGRCFRVCSRGVLQLLGIDEAGDHVPLDDEDEDEHEKKVMTIAYRGLCVGCTACAKICPKGCYTHAAAQV
ncbi:ferredoxin III, nif-specific [Paraburkholderia sp. CNPSo 3076]|uniref:ferredoxin III, nif-specific n=1 Tax=Paraburkholderia sp. CNPSo 3076 TaxID=2940936 RepID=UPI00224E1DB0|nr:ferredoxin III, nif-specific [Paraburkholderia sp. CNPSo 3076]MCX5545371.1 ferredoxin III, nif-specific [Paraburkholderia sp. CNPSo 3076]